MSSYKTRDQLTDDLMARQAAIDPFQHEPDWRERRQAVAEAFVREHLGLPDDLSDKDASTLRWLLRNDGHTLIGVVHLALLGRR